MALTKVTGQVIKNTTDVTVGVLTVTNTLAVGGTVSIGGTLTYEDVTNVDAVGLITARNGIVVGSGITLSKDGDVFFTGIATGNGSGLTALNASNLASGTVPTARLGSGTASSSTFLRGDSTFQTVNTDLVSDTSPQLGGTLDANGNNIHLGDNGRLRCGASQDLDIYHSTHSYIENDTGHLYIRNHESDSQSTFLTLKESQEFGIFKYGTSEWLFKGAVGGSTEMWYDGSKKIETTSTGASITGQLDLSSHLDMGDSDVIKLGDGDDLQIYHSGSLNLIDAYTNDLQIRNGSSEKMAVFSRNGAVELYYDNAKMFYTHSTGAIVKRPSGGETQLTIYGSEGNDAHLLFAADDGDDNADYWRLAGSTDGSLYLQNYTSGSWEKNLKATGNAGVDLYYDNTKRFETTSDGAKTTGRLAHLSEDNNTTFRRDVYYLAIGTNSTSTITLAGLNGTGVFRAGGYTNAGQGALALHILFGGAMFATQHYQANKVIDSAMQNTSISTSKNSTNYTIAISNSSSSYSLVLQIYLESTGGTMTYSVS